MGRISFVKKLLYFIGLRDLNDKVTLDFYPSIRSICAGAYCIGLFLFIEFMLQRVSMLYRGLLVIAALYLSVEVCYIIAIYFNKNRREK